MPVYVHQFPRVELFAGLPTEVTEGQSEGSCESVEGSRGIVGSERLFENGECLGTPLVYVLT